MIDLVRNDGDAGVFGAADQFGKRRRGGHRSRRIGGRTNHHALERAHLMLREQALAGDRPTGCGAGLDKHRLAAERGEDVAIGRITGQCDRNTVARLESGEKRQHETGRGAGGDDDAFRLDVEAVPFLIGARDAPAQRGNTQSLRITMGTVRQRCAHRGDRGRRRTGSRLTDLHVHDPTTLGLQPRRRRHDVHDHERRHVTARRWLQEAFCLFKHHSALKSRFRTPAAPAPLMPYSAGFVTRSYDLATRWPRVDPNPFRP